MLSRHSRLLPPLLTLVLFIWAVAACQPLLTPLPGSTTPPSSSSQTRTAKAPAEKTSPAAKVTPTPLPIRPGHLQIDPQKLKGLEINLWHPFGSEEEVVIKDMVSQFNENNEWGIIVHARGFGGSGLLNQQVQTTEKEDDLPNVIVAPIQQLQSWQDEKNIIIDLNDYINDTDWGLTPAELGDIPLSFLKQDQIENRQLGLPAQRTSQVLLYNQTWAEELGFKNMPASTDDIEKQVCAAAQANLKDTIKDNDGTGGWIVNTDAETWLAWMMTFGLENPGDFGLDGYVFNNQRFREGFSFFKTLYDKGCAWSGRNPTPYDYFANRNTLLYSGTLEDVIQQANIMQHSNNSDAWTVLPYPAAGQKPAVLTNGPSYAIVVATPEQQLASWFLVHWLIDPENQGMMTENSGSWPASVTALENLADFRQLYPQWAQSLAWIPIAQSAPRFGSWVTVRSIFSDAAWQVFQTNTKPETIPVILNELDSTVKEVLKH
jgi:multiple sugar transport system substrate-binding protein